MGACFLGNRLHSPVLVPCIPNSCDNTGVPFSAVARQSEAGDALVIDKETGLVIDGCQVKVIPSLFLHVECGRQPSAVDKLRRQMVIPIASRSGYPIGGHPRFLAVNDYANTVSTREVTECSEISLDLEAILEVVSLRRIDECDTSRQVGVGFFPDGSFLSTFLHAIQRPASAP